MKRTVKDVSPIVDFWAGLVFLLLGGAAIAAGLSVIDFPFWVIKVTGGLLSITGLVCSVLGIAIWYDKPNRRRKK